MDNIVRPDRNIAISKPHNVRESKERLDGLTDTFHRLISRMVALSASEDRDEEVNTSGAPGTSETAGKSPVGGETPTPANSSGPSVDKLNDDELMTLLDEMDECPLEITSQLSEKEQVLNKLIHDRKSEEDASDDLLDDFKIFDLLENVSTLDKAPKEMKTQEKPRVDLSDDFAAFDLSELLNEAPESCLNFQNMETENPDLEIDFRSILNETSAKPIGLEDNELLINPSKSKIADSMIDFYPVEYDGSINEPVENISNFSPMDTNDPFLDLDLDELMNIGKSDKIEEQKIADMPKPKTASPEAEAPRPKYVSFLNNLFTKKTPGATDSNEGNKESEEIKTKRQLILSGKYRSKYSEKMANFLGPSFLQQEEKLKPMKTSVSETGSSETKESTIETKDNKPERLRRQCTLKKKTCYEGYEKKVTRQDPKLINYNKLLMASYHASLVDYDKETQEFQEPPRQSTSAAASADTIDLDLSENLPGPSMRYTQAQKIVTAVKEKDSDPSEKPECNTGSGDSTEQDDKNDNAPLDRALLATLLEEKFQESTFTERTAKFMKSAVKKEGVLMPCTSRILGKYGANKNALLRSPAFNQAKIQSELRKAEHEKLMAKIQVDRIKYGGKKDIFLNEKDELIFNINLYHPVEKGYLAADRKRSRGKPKLAMELEAVSSNTLEELCNNFLCYNDYIGCTELQSPVEYSAANLLGQDAAFEKLPTSTILIHDTVYSFKNPEKGADTGPIIEEWATSNLPKNVGPLKYADIATTQLLDLTVQFGYPYVFIHLDSCEHVVVFSQARKMKSSDNLYARSYPMIKNKIDFANVYCQTHKNLSKIRTDKKYKMSKSQYLARYAIMDSEKLPNNPTLLCRACVDEFFFNEKGKRVGKFKLFPFMQPASAVKDKI